LCAEAALRCGAGLVTLGIPKSLNAAFIKIKPKEVMTLPLPDTKTGVVSDKAWTAIKNIFRKTDCGIIGPGLGTDPSTKRLVLRIVKNITKPLVIDADGLNAIAGNMDKVRSARARIHATTIMTPHEGEFMRLIGLSVPLKKNQRKEVAKNFVKAYNCVIALKGHRTVVADAQGRCFENSTGNPGMATAGSGDCVAGMIGAFLCQGLDAFSATKYAAYVHGLAGDLAAQRKTQIGMIASDIIDSIPEAIKLCS